MNNKPAITSPYSVAGTPLARYIIYACFIALITVLLILMSARIRPIRPQLRVAGTTNSANGPRLTIMSLENSSPRTVAYSYSREIRTATGWVRDDGQDERAGLVWSPRPGKTSSFKVPTPDKGVRWRIRLSYQVCDPTSFEKWLNEICSKLKIMPLGTPGRETTSAEIE